MSITSLTLFSLDYELQCELFLEMFVWPNLYAEYNSHGNGD